jgi:Type II secretion system (T2SS), protein G
MYLRKAVMLLVIAVASFGSAYAKGELSAQQARKLIATMPGVTLKTGAVHVGAVRSIDAATAQASVEIATAFRLEKNDNNQWRVAEVRVGQDQWESLEFIYRFLKVEKRDSNCDSIDSIKPATPAADPGNRRARCLLAELLGVTLPSDAVRIKDVSSISLPFGSKASALVEALITAEFQFSKADKGSWRVSGIRSGTRNWIDPQTIFEDLHQEKNLAARAELDLLAKALEEFRSQRGSYVESKSHAVLIDFLSPRYLKSIIRLDPWRRPYVYEGTINNFTLRSLGPDGKENTADDLIRNRN